MSDNKRVAHIETILDLIGSQERDTFQGWGLSSRVRIASTDVIAVGIDNGNDALKLAMFSEHGALVTVRVPMAYIRAQDIQSGAGEVTYTIDGAAFWTGETALRHEGDDLPVGPTSQRVVDPRWSRSAAAALVELLIKAEIQPGAYYLALEFAIPNTEIVRDTQTNKLGVSEETAQVLKQHVRNQVWKVTRTDAEGQTAEWALTIKEIVPQAQSLGSYTVWSKAPNGKTLRDVDGVIVIDIGGGDLQVTEIALSPYQMITRRIGDGTVAIAQALVAQFPNLELNTVAAQQGLMSRRLLMTGRWRDVSTQVDEAIASEGQNLVGQIVPILRQSRRFVLITGGGVILLQDLLQQRLNTAKKVRGEDYEMIDYGVASLVNSIGALFAMLFKAHRRGA